MYNDRQFKVKRNLEPLVLKVNHYDGIYPLAGQQDKIAFSKRLDHALDLYGVPPKGKGRQVTVGKMFGVSQKAANKWLEGVSLPDTMRIAIIAEKLKVNVEWLTYGAGPINTESLPGSPNSRWKRVPLVSWEQAGRYDEFDITRTTEWTWTDVESGSRTYALVVKDDSMMPRYEPGATIIVDPDKEPQHRNIIIFRWKKTGDVSCAQLLIDGPNRYLKPHSPEYETLLIEEKNPQIIFCGTARQIFMTY
jgi:SOS-response transcriptional repressor LexA